MFLSRLKVKNFRLLKDLDLPLKNGLNVLLGENDSGKTAVVDCIRLILGSRDLERIQLTSDDFYKDNKSHTKQLKIEAYFEGFSDEEASQFLEWLEIKGVNPDGSLYYVLRIFLEAIRKDEKELVGKYDREVTYTINGGPDDIGTRIDPEVRDLLRITYLKPLRDAEQELAARRGSRLSQVLFAHEEIRIQDSNDPKSIVGIMRDANNKIQGHELISNQVKVINENYLSYFLLGENEIKAAIGITDPELKAILEQLKLSLTDLTGVDNTKHGLGLNSLLFMATELLLLGSPKSAALPLLIIEEPEAHLHPQYQMRLMEFLQLHLPKAQARNVQVIMTSHSPNLASKADLECIVLMRNGKTYPLGSEYTKLNANDYQFLRRFLDVTKSNLFFARGVIIVEGDAEQLLLPVIAQLIGRPFEKYGVSIVNVGHVGLFRYSRIFQRKNDPKLDIHVACITDLDIASDFAVDYLAKNKKGEHRKTKRDFTGDDILKKKNAIESRASGDPVITFVSPYWTLEHDLCCHNIQVALLVFEAIKLTLASQTKLDGLTADDEKGIIGEAQKEFQQWIGEKKSLEQISSLIYEPLYSKAASKVETAQYLARLLFENLKTISPQSARLLFPDYLLNAIDYVTYKPVEEKLMAEAL